LGSALFVTTAFNGLIDGNYIHESYDDTDWGEATPNINGICLDDDLVNGEPSAGLIIVNNRIDKMEVGPVFFAAHGDQTDGIHCNKQGSVNHIIANNHISNVGEGIDW